jgi:hypothetical protein
LALVAIKNTTKTNIEDDRRLAASAARVANTVNLVRLASAATESCSAS